MNRIVSTIFFVLTAWYFIANSQGVYSNNLAHTYSIVARDATTGELGVAVQTHWFAVGSRVSWAEAGVGAIATQSFTNVSFGPRGLTMLREGKSAEEVLQSLIDSDEGRAVRQVGIIDSKGNTATWTGDKCINEAGHLAGENYSVQANMMLNAELWPEMAKAFENTDGPLAERLLAALEAAQAAGGDIRGRQSAALVVVAGESTGNSWEGRKIDLRVDDHQNPLMELRRLLTVSRAYQHMNRGDHAIENNDIDTAAKEYGMAQRLVPDNPEMRYWHAISLANIGKVDEALPIFKEIFSSDANWRTLTERLPASDLLNISESDLQRILSQ